MFSLRIPKNPRQYSFSTFATQRQAKGASRRPTSTKAQKVDIGALLKEPSWSVRQTLFADKVVADAALINKAKLHHLLRLSALPAPASSEEESKMLRDLEAQLRFVQTIQGVNTEGVEPLQMIRDERKEAQKKNTITIDKLKRDFEKEEVVGTRGRIRKKATAKVPEAQVSGDRWDPLRHAGRTQGPYLVINTAKG